MNGRGRIEGWRVARYKVDIRQDAAAWVSNNREPSRAMPPAEKAAYLRRPGWGLPTIDGTIAVFTRARPTDTDDLAVDIKPGTKPFTFEIFSK
jgi:hypothetical protein